MAGGSVGSCRRAVRRLELEAIGDGLPVTFRRSMPWHPSRSPVRPALQTAWEIAWRRSQPHMMYQTIRSAASHMGTSVRDSGPKNFWDRPEFEFRP